jgi:uncharacterized protein
MSLLLPTTQKRLESDYYVEGFATTFDAPYLLYEYDGIKYFEAIDRHALDGADLTDVIMQYDHMGRVFARTKMGGGKPRTLIAEPQASGFFVAADLSLSDASRNMYTDITTGLVHQMSWAFMIASSKYDTATRTRTILKVSKVYDVSAVSIPANADTEISARSFVDGVIEEEKREAQERLALAKAKYFYFNGGNNND